MNIKNLIRKHILELAGYKSGRSIVSGGDYIFLDTNENPFNKMGHKVLLNRYPDPFQKILKQKIAEIKKTSAENIFLANGSDDVMDLLVKLFCEREDKVMICPPTFGIYEVIAKIYNLEVVKVNLDISFNLQTDKILENSQGVKMIFLCSPNNPTGNLMKEADVTKILNNFQGIVVLDEAYIDFASRESLMPLIEQYNNLIVVQTFSKAWGLAGLRLGIAVCTADIIDYLNNIKMPYNINVLSQQYLNEYLNSGEEFLKEKTAILKGRQELQEFLSGLEYVEQVYPSEANFILFKSERAEEIYQKLLVNGISIRSFASDPFCLDCLRISIGQEAEMDKVSELMRQL